MIPFPENVITELGLNAAELPCDFIGTLHYIVYTWHPNHADMFFMYYQDKMTLAAIGEAFDVSRANVHEMIKNILNSLRKPGQLAVLKAGMRTYQKLENKRVVQRADESSFMHACSDLLCAIENDISQNHLDKYSFNDTIDMLGLSKRVYNCLRRAGIATIADIQNAGSTELIGIRHLGEKGYQEIVAKLVRKYGESESRWAMNWE